MTPLLSANHAASGRPSGSCDGKLRLLIVDDHPIVRFGMSSLLKTQKDFVVVGAADSSEAALALLREHGVDAVLLDLRMPGTSGVESLKQMRAFDSGIRVIIVSSFEYDEEIYAAVKAGAQGFLHKESSPEAILGAIREVAQGKQSFPKHIMERLTSDHMSAGLSSRQLEILQMVARGLTNKEVAKALNLSQFTVRNHLNHITQKLEATDRTEAIFIALQTGLISPP